METVRPTINGFNLTTNTGVLPGPQPDSITLTAEQIQMMVQMGVSTALNKVIPKHGREDQGTGSEVIGRILRECRARLGFSQEDLAVRSGVHRSTIGKIETAARGMSMETFAKLYYGFSKVEKTPVYTENQTEAWLIADVFRNKIIRHYAGDTAK